MAVEAPPIVTITGAFSYTGSAIAGCLLERGIRVRTLTNRRTPIHRPGGPIEVAPLQFTDPAHLVRALRGSRVLVNTYWVRYPSVGVSFDEAVVNTNLLFQAAVAAGVHRIVHLSVSNPSLDSPLGYYRGKAQAEALLQSLPVSHAIIRPTLVVGAHDILVNNIAWFLRRFPLFGLPDGGKYRLQPITLDDVGVLVAQAALDTSTYAIDAAGPEVLTFAQFVHAIGVAIGHPARSIAVPPALALQILRLVGLWVGETILAREELEGLMTELLVSHAPPRGTHSVLDWLRTQGYDLGRAYAGELARHAPSRARGTGRAEQAR